MGDTRAPRVCMLTEFWPTRANPINGIFVKQQVRALRNAGAEVVVVAPRVLLKRTAKRPHFQTDEGIQIISPRYLSFPGGLGFRVRGELCTMGMMPLLEQLQRREKFDLVHVQGLGALSWAIPCIKQRLSLATVLTVHGENGLLLRRASRPAWRSRLRRIWGALDEVVAVGNQLRPYLRRVGVGEGDLRVIANGTNVVTEAASGDSLGSRGRTGRAKALLSVSNLTPTKGVEQNVKAVHRLVSKSLVAGFTYNVIGDGPEKRSLQKLVRQLGLDGCVRFLGRLRYSDTMQHLQRCDVFSLPSSREAFGIVYLEAMARGKPVIGCRGSGCADFIRHGVEGYLIAPGDVDELSRTIAELLNDTDKASRLGEAGRRRVREFTWEANASKYMELYEQLSRKSVSFRHACVNSS